MTRSVPRRAVLAAALAAVSLAALVGCASAGPAEPAGGITEEAVEETTGGERAPIDADTLDALDAQKAAFDGWMYDWQSSGCDEERAASGDLDCATILSFGQLEATATAIAFGSLDDFGIGDEGTDAVARTAAVADVAGTNWVDAECAGDPSPTCAASAREFVQSLAALQEELLQWSR
jgi:hypothetical protein